MFDHSVSGPAKASPIEYWENERWVPFSGFASKNLWYWPRYSKVGDTDTERQDGESLVDLADRERRAKEVVFDQQEAGPDGTGGAGRACDRDGWQYAVDWYPGLNKEASRNNPGNFLFGFHRDTFAGAFVRRRKIRR